LEREAIISIYERLKISPIWRNKWALLEDFTYYTITKWEWEEINIPKWFIFNGASIPRVFYIIGTPMATDTLIAATIHDYLYSTKTKERVDCDDLFYNVMKLCKVFILKRVVYYLWVRIWWWVVWKGYKLTN
jgi:hypothetical protein